MSMALHFPLYSIVFMVNIALVVVFAFVAWGRRATPGAKPFALLMLAVAEWVAAVIMEAAVVGMPDKVFWSKVEYLGIASAPVLWLMFAVEYSRHKHWLTRRNLILLWIEPVITVLMAVTNEWHRLLWSDITPAPGSGGAVLIYSHGTWFWVMAACDYVMMLAGVALLIRAVMRYPQLYRNQVGALIAGTVATLAGNVIYLAGLSPVKGLDTTPFGFVVTGLIYALTIFRLQFFDLVPVAREALIENMADGVLVLDGQNRIVDINPAAQGMLDLSASWAVGQCAEDALAAWPDLAAHLRGAPEAGAEITLERGVPRYLDLRITALQDRYEWDSGRLLVLRDVTRRKLAEEALRKSEEQYRELMERDLELAHRIQVSLLPQEAPWVPGLEIAARSIPAQQVGGDFYRYLLLPDGRFGLAIGDVSGKGVPSALLMAMVATAIDTRSHEHLTAGGLLSHLNRSIYSRMRDSNMNVALLVAIFNTSEGYMQVSNAGMITPLVVNESGSHWPEVSGLPIGVLPSINYGGRNAPLGDEAIIVFISDGIVEAMNERGELFGFERLQSTVERIAGYDPEAVLEGIWQAVSEHVGQAEPHDDMTVVVVRARSTKKEDKD